MCKMIPVKMKNGQEIFVSEYKATQIECLLASAADCKEIQQIILFGSVLEDSCTLESDVDFAVITEMSVAKLSQNKRYRTFLEALYAVDDFQTEYDILYFKSYDEIKQNEGKVKICDELLKKGKVIYQRGEKVA